MPSRNVNLTQNLTPFAIGQSVHQSVIFRYCMSSTPLNFTGSQTLLLSTYLGCAPLKNDKFH